MLFVAGHACCGWSDEGLLESLQQGQTHCPEEQENPQSSHVQAVFDNSLTVHIYRFILCLSSCSDVRQRSQTTFIELVILLGHTFSPVYKSEALQDSCGMMSFDVDFHCKLPVF